METRAGMLLPIVLTFLLVPAAASMGTNNSSIAMPGCQSRCGGVDIPYPFGISNSDCYRPGYSLTCNHTTDKLFGGDLFDGQQVEILDIDLERGELRASMPAGVFCYSRDGKPWSSISSCSWAVTGTPLTFSSRNVFAVTGCDSVVYFSAGNGENFTTGCMTMCTKASHVKNGTCKGTGCCQLSIPEGQKYFLAEFKSLHNYTDTWELNGCGYGFLVEEGQFEFNTTILTTLYYYGDLNLPVLLDWAIDDNTCEAAKKDAMGYACRSSNSNCTDYEFGAGYRCNCLPGFQGNPYLHGGCQDINECDNPDLYPCYGTCKNTEGNYTCTCEPGSHSSDAKSKECVPSGSKIPFVAKLLIGIGAGFLFLMVVTSWMYWGFQKRKMILLKQKFFQQNGGLFLEQQISSIDSSNFKIFSIKEMRSATNNFEERLIIGRGGNGVVYKGILDDGRVVAIKRSTVIDQNKNREFAKEMFILSQINHVYIVKLLGCCLEVEVPMLIYEFIPNGTLFHLLHYHKEASISFEIRLKIAKETAEALSYLHSAADPPILHGDIKSSNILLDNNYQAKVSDFGTSVLAPNDKAQFTTFVQGTCGYLDPEYMQTCQLTEKSDVYSFGVVLVELLTRRKAFNFGGTEEEKSLAVNFISCLNNNRLNEILDPAITSNDLKRQVHDLSRIALQCLSLNGDDRPTMKELYMELQATGAPDGHPWMKRSTEETEWLLDEPVDEYTDTTGLSISCTEIGSGMNAESGR